jgi:uncharacterized protein YpmS
VNAVKECGKKIDNFTTIISGYEIVHTREKLAELVASYIEASPNIINTNK